MVIMKPCVILLLAVYGLAISDATLTNDIDDFVDLFPTNSMISDIIAAYITSDQEAKAAIEYIQSPEIESRIEALTNQPEFEAIKNFVEDAGLELSVAINAMSRMLGVGNLMTPYSAHEKTSEVIISGGFEGFFRDILGAFPTESIAALREKKLISSKFFATFVEKITSKEFQDRLTDLQATKEYQELFKLLYPRVNLFHFVNLFASAIGLGSDGVAYSARQPASSLDDDLNDFFKLSLNSDDVAELGKEYFKADSEIRHMIDFQKSDEFTELFSSLEETEEYLALAEYFHKAGLDLKSAYYKFYSTFVQHRLSTSYSNEDINDAAESDSNVEITGELERFFADYKDKKPTELIAALHRKKRANSAALNTFVEKTKSEDLIALRNALEAKEAFKKIEEKLISFGVSHRDFIALFNQSIGTYTDESV